MNIFHALVALATFLPILAQADNVLHPGNPVLDRPTLISLGVQLPVSGDDNYNASVTMKYRSAGDSSWKQALPLYRVHPDTTSPYIITPQFAGSILDLRPATTYEIQLHVTDPDGPVDQSFSLTATTRSMPGDPVNPRIVNVFDANSLSQAMNNAQPGDIVTLANGIYPGQFFAISRSGTATNPIVIRGASRDGVIVDGSNCLPCNVFEFYGSYIHIERLTVQNAERAIKFQTVGAQGNVVRGVRTTNTILGITGKQNQLDFYIADNIVEGRLTWPRIYLDDNGLHAADDGINVQGFGHVIAHNRISGFGKAMQSSQSGARAIDFYGNDILWSYDNGVKLDFLEGNGRVLRNRFSNTYMTISLQPVAGGPAYVVRNVSMNTDSEQLKLHSHANPTVEPNGVFAYNNTFVSANTALALETPTSVHHFALENNLFIGPQNPVSNTPVDFFGFIDDGLFDYNGYWPDGFYAYNFKSGRLNVNSFAALQQAGTGLEPHGLLVNPQVLASGIIGPPDYTVFYPPQDFTLSSNSIALDRGVVLPNISDVYTGSAPDLGALELGCPAPIYGPRPPGVDETNQLLGCTGPPVAPPPPTPPPPPPASIGATGGTPQAVAINTVFAPLQATVTDANTHPVANSSVTFTTPASASSCTFPGNVHTAMAVTNNAGLAVAPSCTATNTPGGPYTVAATVSGVPAGANFQLTNKPVPTLTVVSGNGQSAMPGQSFLSPLVVRLTDGNGNGLAQAPVSFRAPQAGAGGVFLPLQGTALVVTTDASGMASAAFAANAGLGSYPVTADANGLEVVFNLINSYPAFAALSAVGGTPQSATVNTAFTQPLQVKVTDAGANGIPNIPVTFSAPGFGPSGTFQGNALSATVATGAGGIAIGPAFTANGSAGLYFVAASIGGLSPVNFLLINTAAPPPPPPPVAVPQSVVAIAGTPQSVALQSPFSALEVKVLDGSKNPLAGIAVTFIAPGSGPSGTFPGIAATATAATDASGIATAPAFVSNNAAGSYTVTATVSGLTPAIFSLTNTPPVAAPPPCMAPVASDHWKGEYFNNMLLIGSPAMVRDDGTDPLNFNWGNESSPSTACNVPGILFSVRWTRSVTFTAGTYQFQSNSHDGLRLYIDGQKVVDRWFNQSSAAAPVSVTLTGGIHTLVVEYYETRGGALAALSWQLL